MYSAIVELGYSPGIESTLDSSRDGATSLSVPEPILSALQLARSSERLIFVDFYAEWCLACKVLETDTLKNPGVISALEGYEFLKVDTDLYPDAASFYNIVGMPTLLVLNQDGEEIYRSVGLVDSTELEAQLQRLAIK